MPRKYPELVFTESVKGVQERYGTRDLGRRLESMDWPDSSLGDREASFIAERDSFYVATVGETGWPYVQFRGGPRGFLKVLDEQTLGFADFRGNQQYITTGNLEHDHRVALFLMDYPNRRRLKVMARAEICEAHEAPELLERVAIPNYGARIERVVLYHVAAFDWNCPQHITPRFTEEEWEGRAEALRKRVLDLEARLAELQ